MKSSIEKRENQTQGYKIQVFNNNIIDDFIQRFEEEINARPSVALLFEELWALNQPFVFKQYQRILNSPYIDSDWVNQMMVRNLANQRLNEVVNAEVERISKNLDYMQGTLNKYDANLQEYEKIAKREGKTANRKKVLDQCRTEKYRTTALTSYGINIPSHVNTYRDLDLTAEALNRQTQMGSEWSTYDLANRQARLKGLPEPYTKKQWIWTNRGETTRHKSNDGQTVDFYDYFEIINDKTGRVDMMLYPHDPNASYENSWICYCQMRAF